MTALADRYGEFHKQCFGLEVAVSRSANKGSTPEPLTGNDPLQEPMRP